MRIGSWSVRRPRLALAAWVAFVVGAVALGSITGTKTLDNGAVGESARGYEIMEKNRLWGPGHELAYLRARRAPVPAAAIADVERRLAALGLKTQSNRSADGRSAVVSVQLTGSVPVERIRTAVAAAARSRLAVDIRETGDVSADEARERIVDSDLRRAELLSVPVTLLVLLFAFGALTAALVPVVLALTAVAAGMGLLGPLSQLFPVEDSAQTVVLLIGMAVGVDYALFFVVRSRAERARGRFTDEALETTLRTSGRAVFVSGATVAIAMAGMYVVGIKTLSGIATAAIAVIGCAVLGSVTVLPATLRLLGPRIDRGRIPLLQARTEGGSRFWSTLVARVMQRPVFAATVSTTLLIALAYPALSLRISKPSDLALSAQNEPALQTLDDVRRAFPSAGETAVIATEAPAAAADEVRGELERLSRLAVEEGLAGKPVDPTRIRSTDGSTAAALLLPLTGNGANATSRHAVDELRRRLIPETVGRIPSAATAVTGPTAEDLDFTRRIHRALPYVIGFVLVLAFALLLVAFRSIVVPLKAILLNLLSVGASYGLLAIVFQHHWAEPILGFQSNGTIVSWLPLFLFVVLFGLSMDYHVFILSRVREAVDRGEPTDTAVRGSIAITAGVVTTAAVVMVCVFALFGTLSSLELKQAGVGLAAAVLIDATVIRAVLLPATMKLLGEWNWYLPRRLGWLPRLGYGATEPRRAFSHRLSPSPEAGRFDS